MENVFGSQVKINQTFLAIFLDKNKSLNYPILNIYKKSSIKIRTCYLLYGEYYFVIRSKADSHFQQIDMAVGMSANNYTCNTLGGTQFNLGFTCNQ